jgi:DNA-binding response OmpR family regulator
MPVPFRRLTDSDRRHRKGITMPRLLVVEDEPNLAMGLEDDLKLEGYEVEVARDGAAASERAQEQSFDLIILDVMLPRKDGFEVCRELRRAGLRVPIILLTAKTQESDKVLGLELGADDYVTKPFSPRELRARVKAVLRRYAGETPETYKFGDAEVDFTRGELRRAGEPVDLTPIEFKLLAAFVRLRGRVLSRDRLLDEVWGRDIALTDRVVDTHITNLRKKIEPQPSEPQYIISVRGMGYRFDG